MTLFFLLACCRLVKSERKELRVLLPRWTDMEIEMLKSQLRDYSWIKSEKDDNNNKPRRRVFTMKRRKRRKKSGMKYRSCELCKKYYKVKGFPLHKKICQEKHLVKVQQQMPQEQQQQQHKEEKAEEKEELTGPFELRPFVSCKDCKKLFATMREIFEHRQYLKCIPAPSDEESDLSDNTDDEYEYDTLYTCRVCRAKFISSDLLEAHRTKEKHKDDKSKRSPSESINLVVVKKEHEDFTYRSFEDNQYSCATCNNGTIYHDPDDLLKHHRAVHSSSDVYCRYCAQKLNSVAEFNDHHYIFHELQDFCRVCNERDQIASDKLLSSSPPAKPVCLGCCRKLRLPYKNCLTLLKENLYCDDCERVMPTVAHIRFHNCSKAERDRPQQLSLSILACPLCMETFNGLRSLYRHIIKHNDVMSFRCDDCGKLHETWRALKEHVNKCHNQRDMRLPKTSETALRKTAVDVIRRFVKNGVKLLI